MMANEVKWYNNESGWNAMTYPWSQTHFWWHSLWVKWDDWIVTVEPPLRISIADN